MNHYHYEIAFQAYMAYYADAPEVPFDKLAPTQQKRWYRAARGVCALIASRLAHVPIMSTRGEEMNLREWTDKVMEHYL